MSSMQINNASRGNLLRMHDSSDIPYLSFRQQKAGKLSQKTIGFELPSGYTCGKFAKECMSTANKETGKITDGPDTKFRCWSATQEAYATGLRKQRHSNRDVLRKLSLDDMVLCLSHNLHRVSSEYYNDHEQLPILRIHVAGEFFSEDYFLSWLTVVNRMREYIQFAYAYTKALPYWIKYKNLIPNNLRLRASKGGKYDHLIEEHNLPSAEVVFDMKSGLELDHDDTKSRDPNNYHEVGLLLHATQPKGSEASASLQKLKKEHNWTGYPIKHKKS